MNENTQKFEALVAKNKELKELSEMLKNDRDIERTKIYILNKEEIDSVIGSAFTLAQEHNFEEELLKIVTIHNNEKKYSIIFEYSKDKMLNVLFDVEYHDDLIDEKYILTLNSEDFLECMSIMRHCAIFLQEYYENFNIKLFEEYNKELEEEIKEFQNDLTSLV
jgi:hypothetical protein